MFVARKNREHTHSESSGAPEWCRPGILYYCLYSFLSVTTISVDIILQSGRFWAMADLKHTTGSRANSTASSYLGPELNISEIYRLCCTEQTSVLVKNIYNPVTKKYSIAEFFVTDFNIRFFFQCTKCNAYYEAVGEDRTAVRHEWKQHKRHEWVVS